MSVLANRLVLVTGAAGAVGAATVRAVVSAGGQVIATDIDEERLCSVVATEARRIRLDVRDEAGWADIANTITSGPTNLYGLVTCAAVMDIHDGDLSRMSAAAWQDTLAVNAQGAIAASRVAIELMANSGGGSIVHVSSIVGTRGSSTAQLAYTASKGAVSAITRELAVTYASAGIRVNSVAAGLLDTPLTASLVARPPELLRRVTHIPLGRLGRPDEVASACVWLLSDASSYVTAAELNVDGGLSSAFVTGRESV